MNDEQKDQEIRDILEKGKELGDKIIQFTQDEGFSPAHLAAASHMLKESFERFSMEKPRKIVEH